MTKLTQPYHECKNFDVCSCNVCPLDPLQNEKEALKGEEKCKVGKPRRQKIALKYPNLLPYQGLTKRQFNGKKNWEALGDAEKQLAVNRLSKALKLAQNRHLK